MGNPLTRLVAVALTAASLFLGASPTSARNTSLLVIGDSITCGMVSVSTTCGRGFRGFARLQENLLATGTFNRVTVDAVYSRNAAGSASTRRHGAKTLAEYLRRRPGADAIIVALGSNDLQHSHRPAYFEEQIRAVLDVARGRPVAWVNVYRSDRTYYTRRSATFNAVLARMSTVYPNLVVVDWNTAIRANPQWQAFDRLHLTSVGYRARVAFYLQGATATWQMLNPETTTTTTFPDSATTTAPTTTAPTTTAVDG